MYGTEQFIGNLASIRETLNIAPGVQSSFQKKFIRIVHQTKFPKQDFGKSPLLWEKIPIGILYTNLYSMPIGIL